MSSDEAIKKTKEQTEKLEKTVPQNTADHSIMQIEATVDATPQELRKKIKPFYQAAKDIPSILPPESQIVLHALFSCFDKQKRIEEGKVKDMVWGFEQSGIPPGASLVGLKQLENLKYISFQGADGGVVSILSDSLPEMWVKYEDKLLDLVYVTEGK